jgi:regulator of protease activity HflC (stomatin/prohibitin superfamily)
MRKRNYSSTISLVAILLAAATVGGTAFHWMVNRIYVPEGQSLLLRYKGPLLFGSRKTAVPGQLARVDEDGDPLEIGVLAELRGPGRHFFCPIWWERTLVDDLVVDPGKVAIVTSKLGDDPPPGQFLVDGDLGATKYKGILRKVYGPGRYRVNPHAYEFKIVDRVERRVGTQVKTAGWVNIPTGYVGVATNLADNPLTKAKQGVQQEVLPPGLYPINPREQEIDIVNIGFREMSISVKRKLGPDGHAIVDTSGEPQLAEKPGGISFPSNDGFPIHMDFTAIWGIMPEQAAEVVRKFGDVDAVEQKVVVPQIESICRNKGSQLNAVELLVGESRQQFQVEVSKAFQDALSEKDITLLYGLVRYINIPQEVRLPIQQKYISDELKLTRDQEILTAKTEASLREAERKVELEAERIKVETEKLVAGIKAEGAKKADQIKAETTKQVAAIDKQTAALDAQATIVLGQAENDSKKLLEEAKAQKFELAVAAFGSGSAYNQWVFASGLPEDIQLNLLYAGQGTFWTDLKGFTEVMLGRQALQDLRPGPTAPRPAPQPRPTNP